MNRLFTVSATVFGILILLSGCAGMPSHTAAPLTEITVNSSHHQMPLLQN